MTTKLLQEVGNVEYVDWSRENVRASIEEDVDKCRLMRTEKCRIDLDRGYPHTSFYRAALGEVCKESQFEFDTSVYPLRQSFLNCIFKSPNIPQDFELEYLHAQYTPMDVGKKSQRGGKSCMLQGLLEHEHRQYFHETYDQFVLQVICPHLAKSHHANIERIYYQAFPCIRVVRPGEFSIGIHSDISYGCSQASVNFWVPLTRAQGTNSLVVESEPEKEDWHSINATYGDIHRFHGSLCSHFTTMNTTATTRVSLDFRVVLGILWEQDHDRYTSVRGYYASASKDGDSWIRDCAQLLLPDNRNGYPFVDRPQTAQT